MKELLKIIVQPVVLERDEEGRIVGEMIGDPRPLYTLEELDAYRSGLTAQIEKENGNGDGPA